MAGVLNTGCEGTFIYLSYGTVRTVGTNHQIEVLEVGSAKPPCIDVILQLNAGSRTSIGKRCDQRRAWKRDKVGLGWIRQIDDCLATSPKCPALEPLVRQPTIQA